MTYSYSLNSCSISDRMLGFLIFCVVNAVGTGECLVTFKGKQSALVFMVEQSQKVLTVFTIQLGLTSQMTEFINTDVRTTWFPRQYYYVTSRIDSVLLFNTITRQSDRFMHQTFINIRNSGGQIALGTLKSGNISPACWKDYKFCLRFSLLLILHKSAVKY